MKYYCNKEKLQYLSTKIISEDAYNFIFESYIQSNQLHELFKINEKLTSLKKDLIENEIGEIIVENTDREIMIINIEQLQGIWKITWSVPSFVQ